MEIQVLPILVLAFAHWHLGDCKPGDMLTLGEVMKMHAGRRSLANPRSGSANLCEITKPDETCLEKGPPVCSSKTCTFVPQYGEEITSLWQIFFDGFAGFFNRNKKKKYRRILDLGEKVTKSFPGEICENENTLCDCTAKDLTKCNCGNTKEIKVCKQKYKYKFSLYYAYNFFFCEPKPDPWALLFKKLTGSSRRHLSYADSSYGGYYPSHPPKPKTPNYSYLFQYLTLLKKDKHHHLGNLVLCEEKEDFTPSYSPYKGFSGYGKYYHQPAYLHNPNTLVRHAFLKVKVPSGCECDEY